MKQGEQTQQTLGGTGKDLGYLLLFFRDKFVGGKRKQPGCSQECQACRLHWGHITEFSNSSSSHPHPDPLTANCSPLERYRSSVGKCPRAIRLTCAHKQCSRVSSSATFRDILGSPQLSTLRKDVLPYAECQWSHLSWSHIVFPVKAGKGRLSPILPMSSIQGH